MSGTLTVILCLAGIVVAVAAAVRWYYRGGGPAGYYHGDDADRVSIARIHQNHKGRGR